MKASGVEAGECVCVCVCVCVWMCVYVGVCMCEWCSVHTMLGNEEEHKHHPMLNYTHKLTTQTNTEIDSVREMGTQSAHSSTVPPSRSLLVLASGSKCLSSTLRGALIILLRTLPGPSVGSSCHTITRPSSRLHSALKTGEGGGEWDIGIQK